MRRIVIAASVLLTIIFTLIFFYFKDVFTKDDDGKLFTFIPPTASVIIEFNNDASLYELYKGSPLIPSLFYDNFLQDVTELRSLFIDNPLLKEKFKNKKIIASLHQVKSEESDVLFVMPCKASDLKDSENLFKEFISAKNTLTTRNFEGEKLYELHFSEIRKTISFCVKNNVLLLSYTPFLIESAIRKNNDKTALGEDPLFQKARTIKGKGTIMEVYLNYKQLPELFQTFFTVDNYRESRMITELGGYSSLSINYKSDAWMLSGQTLAEGTSITSVFQNQLPQKQTLPFYFSNRTAFFYTCGISDYLVFLKDIKNTELLRGDVSREREIERVNKAYRIFLEDELISIVGNEFALAVNESDQKDDRERLAFLKLKNPERAVQLFTNIQETARTGKDIIPSQQVYKEYTIRPVVIKSLMNIIAGDFFRNFQSKYYVIVEDRMVIASELNAIQRYIDDYSLLQTLAQSNFYTTFYESIGDKSNFYFYINTDRSSSVFASGLNDKANNKFNDPLGINYYSAFAYQISSNNKNLFTNIYFPLRKEESEDIGMLWKVKLDGIDDMRPFIVENHQTHEQEIMVQDDENKLYLISATGKIIWKTQLSGKIISNIYQVDYYKNEKLQFLFNTKNQLYLIDRNGMMMPNYPIRLSTNATCGLALFDYDQTKDYRIFISCDNRSIFGYAISGRTLDGWNPKQGVGILEHPVQHAYVSGKDYLFVNNSEGDFYFFNRRGDLLSRYDDKEKTSYRNPFVFDGNPEFAKNRFINTDINGKIKSVFMDGRRLYKHIGNWSESHFFNYANVSGDSAKEYLYLDKNQLFIYKDDSSIVYNYEFQSDSTSPIQLFPSDSGKFMVGVTSLGTSQVFLFNEDGKLKKGFPMEGRTMFSLMEQKNTNKYILVVGGKEHYLYAYKIIL
jgi:hypothetical protein